MVPLLDTEGARAQRPLTRQWQPVPPRELHFPGSLAAASVGSANQRPGREAGAGRRRERRGLGLAWPPVRLGAAAGQACPSTAVRAPGGQAIRSSGLLSPGQGQLPSYLRAGTLFFPLSLVLIPCVKSDRSPSPGCREMWTGTAHIRGLLCRFFTQPQPIPILDSDWDLGVPSPLRPSGHYLAHPCQDSGQSSSMYSFLSTPWTKQGRGALLSGWWPSTAPR